MGNEKLEKPNDTLGRSEAVELLLGSKKLLKANLRYAYLPSKELLDKLTETLEARFPDCTVMLETVLDKTLINGYVLKVGDEVTDNSFKGKLQKLVNKVRAGSGDVISLMRSEIEGFDGELSPEEGGLVRFVGDGIASVDGISHAEYGEIVVFECGVRGMVQNISPESIDCIIFGSEDEITEGSKVLRTHRSAGIPVSEKLLGRVVDPLGTVIDGKAPVEAEEYCPAFCEAPGVIDRKPVNVPLQTGILSIDSMFPIGRGQRELIIGDRQTGKTSIALDTIINQRDKNVICVYVAIGQKASSIAHTVRTLKENGALDNTVILAATASDCAPLQYIAPYAGTAIAEYFMHRGRDVLIVYDDLTKHAVAYRALSLLLKRPPGREAYPGDVFYLHSRLLERSCRLNDAHGGGSLTALPIVETQASDISAYIPTNVISITDGQIFLESDLFFAGIRPAVNVGLSVSRVGGAAQTKAMKKLSGTLRIDLAQYNEMRSFTQFSSDLDEETAKELAHGGVLTELLKQPLCKPKSLCLMLTTLYLAKSGALDRVGAHEALTFSANVAETLAEKHPETAKAMNRGEFGEDTVELIEQIVTERLEAGDSNNGKR